MGRVVGKSSCNYMVLDMTSSQMEAVGNSKHAFLQIDPNQGRNTENTEVTPSDLKNYMDTDRVPVKVKPCRCGKRCALNRLREKHGNYVDCTIYFV